MNKRELKGTLIAAAWEENEGDYHVRLEDAFEIIDQLDEPDEFDRVLLKHIKDIYNQYEYDYLPGFINDIKDDLAKMDEPEKLVVPQEWFDIIKIYKKNEGNLWMVLYEEDIVSDESDDFTRAWLAYPNIEVEKEKKYEVKDKNDCFLLTKNSEGEVINAYSKVVYKNKGQLTEQEIKDYDERYWPFAEEVK